jgi:hypothetical protein
MTYLMQFQRDQQRDYSLTTVPCIGILKPPKMPESSKMTWNNYRSGKRQVLCMFSPKYFAESTTSRVLWPWMLYLWLMMFLLLVMLVTWHFLGWNSHEPVFSHFCSCIHGHNTLEVVDSAKYLGLNIHKSLKWNDHINQVTKKAISTLAHGCYTYG